MGDDARSAAGDDGTGGGFLTSDNVWILVPLAALSIPIIALTSENVILSVVIGAVALIAAATLALRYLLGYRHQLRLEEIAARERLALAERERLSAVDRLLQDEAARPAAPLEQPVRRTEPADREAPGTA